MNPATLPDAPSGSDIRRLWVASTPQELLCAPLRNGPLADTPWPCLRDGDVAGLVSGCGPTAGAALAWFLASHRVEEIVGLGIAGAYPGSPCRMGSVYRIRTERFLELGAEAGTGQEIAPLDFPGLAPIIHELASPADLLHLETAEAATVALATGTAQTATRRRMAGVDLENMEGAAWALVARAFGTPFAEVRSVSNIAGPRRPDTWDIPSSLAALRAALASSKQPTR